MDFIIIDHGTLVAVQPLTNQARQWLDESTENEPYQWMGEALMVGHSQAQCLINGILEAGYTI